MKVKKPIKKEGILKLTGGIIFLFIALMILSGFFDLAISQTLFQDSNTLGEIIDSFGEVPGALFIVFALFVMNTNIKIRNANYKKAFFIFEVLISSFLFIYILNLFFDYFNTGFNFRSIYGVSIILAFALISLIGFYLFKTKFKKFSERNYLFSKITIFTFIISGIIIYLIKFVWGRVRYEDVLLGTGNFSSWFIPNWFSYGNSFPSGHAFMGWILIPMFLLFLEKDKVARYVTLFLTIIFAIFVSYERIVIGAHYLSDVVFSAGIVLLTFLILYRKNFKKNNLPTAKKKKSKKGKQ